MQVIEVTDRQLIEKFHDFPYQIYKNDPNWIPPLRMMIESIFDKQKNGALAHGNVCRWLVMDQNKIVGRIAAFHTDAYVRSFEQATGGVGFFECIDDQNAANCLFDAARDWLKDEGMEAMDGPINLGENFFNWGLLVDGFKPQTFGMPYNPKYYGKLYSEYGFKVYYNQLSYDLDITSPDLPERFWRIAERVAKRSNFTFEQFRFNKLNKFIPDFIEIYDQAWRKHDNYKRIEQDEIQDMLKQAKLMFEEDFIWFVYSDNRPIAFFMMVPDLNQLFRYFYNGKLNWWKMLKMMYLKKRKVVTRCRVLVMGVVPDFQRKGIESAIFYHIRQVLLRKNWFNDMELSWVGDFNPKMISIFEAVGGKHTKTHQTLRYLFDRTIEFKRSPIIES